MTKEGKNGFTPVKNKRLFEVVAEQIKEAIFTGQYRTGDRLSSEKDLCRSFNVGRPVIREALRTLENSGILTIRPGANGGIFVKKVDSELLMNSLDVFVKFEKVTIEQIIEARLAIEKSVLMLALERIKEDDIKKLEENIALAKDSIETGDPEPRSFDFHIILAEASGNPLLVIIIKALFDVMRNYISQLGFDLERKKRAVQVHEMILRHLKERDYTKVLELMELDITKLTPVRQINA